MKNDNNFQSHAEIKNIIDMILNVFKNTNESLSTIVNFIHIAVLELYKNSVDIFT